MSTSASAYRTALVNVLCAVMPLVLTAIVLHHVLDDDRLAVDFHYTFWPAGDRLLHGGSPFDTSAFATGTGRSFPYGPFDAIVMAVVAIVPRGVGEWGATLLNLAALAGLLRLAGVRDWRVYGVAFALAPSVFAWQTGNVTMPLTYGLVLLWLVRDRPRHAGALFALLVTVKLLVWPVGLWLLATRRWHALGTAVVVGGVVNLLAWAVVGFDEIAAYREVLRLVTLREEGRGYSVVAAALSLDAGRTAAYVLLGVATVAIAAACLWVGRRGRDGDAFLLAVVACLVATPVSWLHYLALLIAPLALRERSLSPGWCILIPLWLCPVDGPAVWQIALAAAVVAALTVRLMGREHLVSSVPA